MTTIRRIFAICLFLFELCCPFAAHGQVTTTVEVTAHGVGAGLTEAQFKTLVSLAKTSKPQAIFQSTTQNGNTKSVFRSLPKQEWSEGSVAVRAQETPAVIVVTRHSTSVDTKAISRSNRYIDRLEQEIARLRKKLDSNASDRAKHRASQERVYNKALDQAKSLRRALAKAQKSNLRLHKQLSQANGRINALESALGGSEARAGQLQQERNAYLAILLILASILGIWVNYLLRNVTLAIAAFVLRILPKVALGFAISLVLPTFGSEHLAAAVVFAPIAILWGAVVANITDTENSGQIASTPDMSNDGHILTTQPPKKERTMTITTKCKQATYTLELKNDDEVSITVDGIHACDGRIDAGADYVTIVDADAPLGDDVYDLLDDALAIYFIFPETTVGACSEAWGTDPEEWGMAGTESVIFDPSTPVRFRWCWRDEFHLEVQYPDGSWDATDVAVEREGVAAATRPVVFWEVSAHRMDPADLGLAIVEVDGEDRLSSDGGKSAIGTSLSDTEIHELFSDIVEWRENPEDDLQLIGNEMLTYLRFYGHC